MKIEYKIANGSKTETKELTLIDLQWKDFCKVADLGLKVSRPNGSQFTDMADFVMLYTGKNNEDMKKWRDSSNSQTAFINEIAIVFQAISEYMESKKKYMMHFYGSIYGLVFKGCKKGHIRAFLFPM